MRKETIELKEQKVEHMFCDKCGKKIDLYETEGQSIREYPHVVNSREVLFCPECWLEIKRELLQKYLDKQPETKE